MANIKWIKSSFKGVRYYKHESRKHGVKLDRYFSGSYQVNKKRRTIGFGWGSEGWTERNVWEHLQKYKANAKKGVGPTTMKEESAQFQEKEFAKSEKLNPASPENITFGYFYKNIYLASAQGSQTNSNDGKKGTTTLSKEQSYFNQWLLPVFKDLKLIEIKFENLDDLKIDMSKKGRAARTIQQCFAIFNKVWALASKRGIVQRISPAKAVDLPKVDNKCTRFFSPEEVKKLLKDLKDRSLLSHDMALISLHSGARRGEIFNLTVSDINFENGSFILDGKTSPRHAYMTDGIREVLERRAKDKGPSDLIFINANGVKFGFVPVSFNTALNKLGLNKGVTDRRERATFHTCRHTFASWHVQNGTDLYIVKELMGHSTIQLTERYAHLRPDGLKVAAKHFNNLVKDF